MFLDELHRLGQRSHSEKGPKPMTGNILPLLLRTPTDQFSLDRKRQSHKYNWKKMEMF